MCQTLLKHAAVWPSNVGIRDQTLASETGHWSQRPNIGIRDQAWVSETRHWYQRPDISIRDQTQISETGNWYQKPDISIREQTLCAVLQCLVVNQQHQFPNLHIFQPCQDLGHGVGGIRSHFCPNSTSHLATCHSADYTSVITSAQILHLTWQHVMVQTTLQPIQCKKEEVFFHFSPLHLLPYGHCSSQPHWFKWMDRNRQQCKKTALNWPQLAADYSWFQWLFESPNRQELWLSPTLRVRDRLGAGRGRLRVFNGGEKASDLRPLCAGHGVHQVNHCIHGNVWVLLQHPAHTNWQRHKTPGTNRNIKLAFFSSQESFTLFNIIWV